MRVPTTALRRIFTIINEPLLAKKEHFWQKGALSCTLIVYFIFHRSTYIFVSINDIFQINNEVKSKLLNNETKLK